MKWSSASLVSTDLEDGLSRALETVAAGLEGAKADIVFAFVCPEHAAAAPSLVDRARAVLGPAPVVGCTAGGVIGGDREVERPGGIALLAGSLPGVTVTTFHVEDKALPDADAGPAAWHALVKVAGADRPGFVVMADPFTVRAEALIAGVDFAWPHAVKVGGLASGASKPGRQVLFAGDRAVRSGAVGVALSGAVDLVPAVAQGCRAFGPVLKVTACEGNLVKALDGEPAVATVRRVLEEAPERDRSLARSSALFVGFETDPFAGEGDERPWLVRNVLGVDREGGGVYVGETLRAGWRVRLHVRDRTTSAEDLDRTLDAALSGLPAPPAAALLFSCQDRGMNLYGVPDHDVRALRRRAGPIPVGGFFCAGEIGPVGDATYLHGYTSSFGFLVPKGTIPPAS